jgi:hypothetical protein
MQVRGRTVPVQAAQVPHVRVHDQFHPQAEAPAGEVHDEQRSGELHNTSGLFTFFLHIITQVFRVIR